MLDKVSVKLTVVTWKVYMCDYAGFEEVLQKGIGMNIASGSVKCKRFVCILLANCVSEVNFGEVVYLNISRLPCLIT